MLEPRRPVYQKACKSDLETLETPVALFGRRGDPGRS